MNKNRNFNIVRKIGNLELTQRTADGMWNATDMVRQWNKQTGQDKRLQHFLELESTKELISYLSQKAEYQEYSKSPNFGELEPIENQSIPKTVITAHRGKYGGTYMCSLLMWKFAAYLSVGLEYDILSNYDKEHIELRNVIADSYRDWSSKLAKLGATTPDDYARMQKCMNYAVFGTHRDGIRDTATTDQLRTMRKLEDQIISMIDFGYLNNLEDVRKYLQKIWQKNYPKPF